MTDEPRTPLTLEYEPEGLEGDPQAKPVIIIEPSFAHPGRIFVGVHPFGRRVGCHLLPEDAARIKEHLGKLLMDFDESPQETTDWPKRIEAAAARHAKRRGGLFKRKRRRRPKLAFRVEFQRGRVQGVIGTTVSE